MIKRLISFILTLVLLVAIPLEARYRYNPYTKKLDFYEAAGDITLGDIGDITLTGLATGNILYYNGTAWVNLATGANAEVLTLAGGIPSWAAGGAPAAHAASHLAAGADPVDHDQLTNYLAAQHLTLPNTLVAVLTDHNAAAHVALGFLALPSTIAAVLTDHNLLAHTALGLFDQSADVDHNLTTNYLAAQHLTLPSTIAAVLTDHNLLAHTALGLFDASTDVDHDATTNWVANKHIDWTAATANFSTSGTFTNGMNSAAEVMNITQTAVAGPGATPLINIDDDRIGATALQANEATLMITAAGEYAVYIADGHFETGPASRAYFTGRVYFKQADNFVFDDKDFSWGTGGYFKVMWDSNGAGDSIMTYRSTPNAGYTAAHFYSSSTLTATAMTDHDDYISPTFVLANNQGADVNDYSGVVIGERTQADVTIAHYFDFLAMAGAADGIPDPTAAEIGAIFRFGALGTTVPTYATAPGDVLIEGALEVAGVFGEDIAEHNLMLGTTAGEDLAAGGTNNVLIGEGAGANITTGDSNTIVGYLAGNTMSTASFSTLVGTEAGFSIPAADLTVNYNTFVGYRAGFATTTNGSLNVFVGWQAGLANTGGYDNVFVGVIAGSSNLTGYMNVYVGNDAGSQATGTGNCFIGGYAGALVSTGSGTLIGNSSGRNMTTGAANTYIGKNAGYTDTDGGFNTGVGNDVQFTQDGAWFNVAMGYQAAYRNVTGQYNTALGYLAGYGAAGQSHSNNVFVGAEAGEVITTGGNNVIIGFQAAEDITSGDGNVIIGYMAAEGSLTTGNNQLWIANTDTATPLIYGEFDTSLLKFTATNVGVVGITNLGDAGTTNYASFAVDGTLTLFGTAMVDRCYQFTNAALGSGAVKPDETRVGNYWGWSYDINDDSVVTVKLPPDYASGTDVEIHIRWAINEAYATDSGEVRWEATWSAHPADASEAINDAGTTDDSGDINIPGTIYFLTETLVETIPGASLSAGDEIGITIKRIVLVGGNDPTADPVITCVGFVYKADKLGT